MRKFCNKRTKVFFLNRSSKIVIQTNKKRITVETLRASSFRPHFFFFREGKQSQSKGGKADPEIRWDLSGSAFSPLPNPMGSMEILGSRDPLFPFESISGGGSHALPLDKTLLSLAFTLQSSSFCLRESLLFFDYKVFAFPEFLFCLIFTEHERENFVIIQLMY